MQQIRAVVFAHIYRHCVWILLRLCMPNENLNWKRREKFKFIINSSTFQLFEQFCIFHFKRFSAHSNEHYTRHTCVQFDAITSISVRFKGDKLFRNPSSSYPGLYGMLAFGRDKRKFTLTAKPAMKMKMMNPN
jgi:hypothetical protein